jgi:hypothetical protein
MTSGGVVSWMGGRESELADLLISGERGVRGPEERVLLISKENLEDTETRHQCS